MITSFYQFTIKHTLRSDDFLNTPKKTPSILETIQRIFFNCLDAILTKLSSTYVQLKANEAQRIMQEKARRADIVKVFDLMLAADVDDLNQCDQRIEKIAQDYWLEQIRSKNPSLFTLVSKSVASGLSSATNYAISQLYSKVYYSHKVGDKAKIKAGYLLVEGVRMLAANVQEAKDAWSRGNKRRAVLQATVGVAYGVMGAAHTAASWFKLK